MKQFIYFLVLFLSCHASRETPSIKLKTQPTEDYRTFQLFVVCERKVNQIAFDYPLSECEEATDTLKSSFQNTNGWYVSETGRPEYYFYIYLEESETHTKLWDYINTFSFGIIPYFANIDMLLKLEIYNSKGEVIYKKQVKEKINVKWHLIYAFHAPFLNPDAVIREALRDMGSSLIQ